MKRERNIFEIIIYYHLLITIFTCNNLSFYIKNTLEGFLS